MNFESDMTQSSFALKAFFTVSTFVKKYTSVSTSKNHRRYCNKRCNYHCI